MTHGEGADPGFRTLSDVESVGSRHISSAVWDYIQGGSGEERTLRANRTAFDRRTVRPKALAGLLTLDPSTQLLGTSVRVPFFIAPTAYQGEIHPEGERATAMAAAGAGVLACISTLSTFSLEEIAAASGSGPRWFQLYLQPKLELTQALVRRAEKASYRAIVLTTDVPLLGVRDRQSREGFALDQPLGSGHGPEFVSPARAPERVGPSYKLRADASSDWSVVDQLREMTKLPIVVKGILRREDARAAVDHGASAVVVSNHGGRQLDGAPATLDVLPEIVGEVGARAEVYLDGGVRRATDIVLALALGAQAVGVGRPILWALGAGGEAGVRRYLELLEAEFVNTMAQLGAASVADLRRATILG